jgi:CheY-like chemotaxis protein
MNKITSCFLVEDDLDDQEIFLMCLRKISPDVVFRVANDGEEAIELLHTESGYTPDIIFIDVNMPRMNGVECLRQIKQMERMNDTRVFMYSTTSEQSVLARTKELGADEFIVKPTKTNDLKEKLSKIFDICQLAAVTKNKT